MIERTPLFLMVNLASEVDKILYWKEAGNFDMVSGAVARARKILDNIFLSREMFGRVAEIKMLDEVIADSAGVASKYEISAQTLKDYFAPFINRFMRQRV